MLLFLGTQLLNKFIQILMLHYKRGLLKAMLDRAFRLSSNWSYLSNECDRLKILFYRLSYPDRLLNSTILRFIAVKASDQPALELPAVNNVLDPFRVVQPFKDQALADIVRSQLKDLSQKIHVNVQHTFVSHKIKQHLKPHKVKPSNINQQSLVYQFKCDL